MTESEKQEAMMEYLNDPNLPFPPQLCERKDEECWIEKRIREAGAEPLFRRLLRLIQKKLLGRK